MRKGTHHLSAECYYAEFCIDLLILTSKEKTPGAALSRTEVAEVKMKSFMVGLRGWSGL